MVLFHYADLEADLEGEMRRLAERLEVTVPEALIESRCPGPTPGTDTFRTPRELLRPGTGTT